MGDGVLEGWHCSCCSLDFFATSDEEEFCRPKFLPTSSTLYTLSRRSRPHHETMARKPLGFRITSIKIRTISTLDISNIITIRAIVFVFSV